MLQEALNKGRFLDSCTFLNQAALGFLGNVQTTAPARSFNCASGDLDANEEQASEEEQGHPSLLDGSFHFSYILSA